MLLFKNSVSSFFEANSAEKTEAIAKLISLSSFRHGYHMLLALSVSIITAGLLARSNAVVIGGMIMAPLLIPILLMSLSIVTRSWKGLVQSGISLLFSMLITLGLSYAITWFMTHTAPDITWIPETMDPNLYLFIAFCSGMAAAFAWVKEEFAPSIAGIAVAISLLPPLCAVGIAASYNSVELAQSSLLLFFINFVGMLVGAVIVFIILGFMQSRKQQEKALKEKNGA